MNWALCVVWSLGVMDASLRLRGTPWAPRTLVATLDSESALYGYYRRALGMRATEGGQLLAEYQEAEEACARQAVCEDCASSASTSSSESPSKRLRA
jgi:hypothetical protein